MFELPFELELGAYIARYFRYAHLPPELQERSKPFAELALQIQSKADGVIDEREAFRTVEKLLEAKDCYVRSFIKN